MKGEGRRNGPLANELHASFPVRSSQQLYVATRYVARDCFMATKLLHSRHVSQSATQSVAASQRVSAERVPSYQL